MQTSSSHLETRAVHGGMAGVRESGSHVPVIDFSTTNPLGSVEAGGLSYEELATGHELGEGRSAVYQRLWQPGVARFEDALAGLEGTQGAVAFASGMAALAATLIATASAGRPHVVAVRPLYGGTDHVLASGLLGTRVTWADAAGIADAIEPDTGLVIVETPANPTLELLDLRAIADAAGSVPVLVDNTFATPVLQRPVEHGATLVLHSATKYLGGHGDVMGGIVAGDQEWMGRLRQVRALTGGLLHPMGAYLLHRGLRTLPLRVRAQQATAEVLARRLLEHPAVAHVRYPGLPGQDPSGLIGTQLDGPGSIIALELVGGYPAAARFTESCDLVTHAVSLGGVDSLVQHPASLTHRPVAGEAKPGAGVVRLSIGLEHVDDLTADLMTALDAAAELDVPGPGRAAASVVPDASIGTVREAAAAR
ncbi:trans-sulfuration enzyme family protein [Agromyces albus]|uniref:trans-sulfuration enzyme family protein n=1 Tax=Agromyces albus TaxID=205332 RepID=UPI00278132C8|nr:PLP-dependent aspartate aminotransferase family protein [Agromyces albus]MDQ0575379.1 cystathionine beta-lyase/cystathionine gamma-synthase [Agromyces albus]